MAAATSTISHVAAALRTDCADKYNIISVPDLDEIKTPKESS